MMGQQFRTRLAEFNQQQLDDMQLMVDQVKATVDQLQQTDIGNLNTKVDNIKTFSGNHNVVSGSITNIQLTKNTLFTISGGKGLIKKLSMLYGSSGDNAYFMDSMQDIFFVIDGIEKAVSPIVNNFFIQEVDSTANGSKMYGNREFIAFENSFEVRVYNKSASYTHPISYRCEYALY